MESTEMPTGSGLHTPAINEAAIRSGGCLKTSKSICLTPAAFK